MQILSCCTLLLALSALPVGAQNLGAQNLEAQNLGAQVDAAAAQVLATTGVPSASVAVVKDGHITYLKSYGMARIEPPMPSTPQMRYPIGSISKQFTASAVLLLAQEGKLTLDDPVAKYLPDLTRAREVTLRMLLSHTSGYQDYWPEDYVMTSMLVPITAQQILDNWAKKPLDFNPGTQWQYSNTNYVIAGRIVEQVSGEGIMEFLRQRVFTPLHMQEIFDADASQLPATDPTGYERFALGPPRPAPLAGAGWMFAAGELAMTAHDLALWDISVMDRTLLTSTSYTQMSTPILLPNGNNTGYGLGVSIGSEAGHAYLKHGGEVSGFVSDNVVYPADRAAVIVLTNTMAAQAASQIAKRIEPLLLGAPAGLSKDEAETLAIYSGLTGGDIDRTRFTEFCNHYFSQQALRDFATSLKPLGQPLNIHQTAQESRGGMIFHQYELTLADRVLKITTYVQPDGKLEQYLVIP